MSRGYTNKLIELVDDGTLTTTQVFCELMCYLSEDDIKEFCLEGFGDEIADEFKEVE